jgi:hypothetical protein
MRPPRMQRRFIEHEHDGFAQGAYCGDAGVCQNDFQYA